MDHDSSTREYYWTSLQNGHFTILTSDSACRSLLVEPADLFYNKIDGTRGASLLNKSTLAVQYVSLMSGTT